MAVQPGLCRTWSETPKTGFLVARLKEIYIHDVLEDFIFCAVASKCYGEENGQRLLSVSEDSICDQASFVEKNSIGYARYCFLFLKKAYVFLIKHCYSIISLPLPKAHQVVLYYSHDSASVRGPRIKKVKTVEFSETFAACDINVGRCRQIIEYMKVFEYLRSRSCLDLGPRSFTFDN